MEMSSAQSCSEMGMEVPDLVGFSEPTAEQLQALVGYHNIFPYESLTSIPTGYPRNLKLPSTVSQLGIRPSQGNLGYERPAKQFKDDSSFQCQQRFTSKVSTPPSIYVPNSQQKLQHNQFENYLSNFFKPMAHQTCENMGPATLCKVCKQAEVLALGGHDPSWISDISHSHIDGSSASSAQILRRNDGSSDMRISTVPTGNRQSNQVLNRASGNSLEHIMAERNRREKLSQRFISLAAIVPGLKKMDKISVLGDAIKYVKQLQDRIKALEEQTSKQTVQSVVYGKKELCTDDQDSDKVSSSSIINSSPDKDATGVLLTPEIEIRVINGNVLIHAYCERRKGLLMKFVEELDKLQLTVVNASIISFSEAAFDLTFNTQMEEGLDLTVTDMVKALEAVFHFHGNDLK